MLWLNFKSRWNTPIMAPIWIFSSVVLQKSSSLEENGNNVQYKSYYIVFSFELYFAFFPLSFCLLTRSVFMSSKFTCQFCSNCIVGAKRVWPKKKLSQRHVRIISILSWTDHSGEFVMLSKFQRLAKKTGEIFCSPN